MRKKSRRSQLLDDSCALCRFPDDDPALFGEKVKLEEDKLSVHYFCLLTSCGVYQRGHEDQGVFGFLLHDIKQEVRRSARLKCCVCKKKGACVGCFVPSCRKMVHFPCGRKRQFISQFTNNFPSFCPDHAPSQTLSPDLDLSLPQSCSVCLDQIEPVLSFSVLKCPSCHTSWFHRDCVQRQAHSAGLFFFKCTLCNNKEQFQEEMLRMGIYIPERDASWELEANAYSELLEVYTRCDALNCICPNGRTHSAKSGWLEVVRCRLCGSRGTHRKCSGLKLETRNWACPDCTQATDGRASLVASPKVSQRKGLLSKRHLSSSPSSISSKRVSLSDTSRCETSPQEQLQSLLPKPCPLSQVDVSADRALLAGLELVRRNDFDPTHSLEVRFKDEKWTPFPSSLSDSDTSRQYFLKLLLQQLQDCEVFEGPDGCKNLALDAQALKDDLYFDVGCLLALALVHGAPSVGFFSPALFQLLFNFPQNQPLTVEHMTPDCPLTALLQKILAARSVSELQSVTSTCFHYLHLSGCNRPIRSLQERDALVEDLISFTMITRMQLPLQRFREGLQTLGVFEQVQLFPTVFLSVFCPVSEEVTAQSLSQIFFVHFSENEEELIHETTTISFWRHFLLECEVGRSCVSLQDLLHFSTGSNSLPSAASVPSPSISFLHTTRSEGNELTRNTDGCLFPQSEPESRRLLLPVSSTYQGFKSSMEAAVSHTILS